MFRPSHSLTVGNAKVTLEEGLRAIAGGETEIDLSDVVAVDSAAVATLLAWQCAALNQGLTLHFSSLPANLESLIDLYGVTELLSPATVIVAASTLHH
ncbi:phospholipid transport system transporter-binding protein [Collimonas sp. OK307]|uniref:STAS domain-containing protein n=1 Tax=Collimonas sp. OK307 TaxID=1801620 RepID=UPI0008EEFDBF|nr:STAS domain-containing protein [Collimonas sp. OK307]SFH89744.1 phospholipid transport system transporter-binding protein [Collimonas sp. OK307]